MCRRRSPVFQDLRTRSYFFKKRVLRGYFREQSKSLGVWHHQHFCPKRSPSERPSRVSAATPPEIMGCSCTLPPAGLAGGSFEGTVLRWPLQSMLLLSPVVSSLPSPAPFRLCVQVLSRGWPDGQGPRCPSGPHQCSLQGHPGHLVFQELPHMMAPQKHSSQGLSPSAPARGRRRPGVGRASERDCRPPGAVRRPEGALSPAVPRAHLCVVPQRRRSQVLKDWLRLRLISDGLGCCPSVSTWARRNK